MKNITFFTLLFSITFTGCVNKSKIDESSKKNKNEDLMSVYFDFPDTVIINKKYNGKIIFKSDLDTITESFNDSIYNRYVFYFMQKGNNYTGLKSSELNKYIKDTIGALNNRTIPLYVIQFNKLGKQYFDGFIYDFVVIDTLKKGANNKHKVKLIENKFRINHQITVIE